MTAMRLRDRVPVPPAFVRAWDRMSSRERRLAFGTSAVVLVAAAWSLVWLPLQEDVQRARLELQRDRAVLVLARAQATEIAGLERSTQPQFSGNPRTAIERVIGERGLQGAVTSLDVKDNRTNVTFAAIGFDALVGLLDSLGKTEGLRAVDARLTSRVEPGVLRAEVTLAR
jgi:general secretion pathway protein M